MPRDFFRISYALLLWTLPILLPGFFAQPITPRHVCDLPVLLRETSGLVTLNKGITFWTHNDSGGEPLLFEIDSSCQVLRTIRVTDATNQDWEEITLDDRGNLFIGDFGNNENNRKDLVVYRISGFDTLTADSVSAARIYFSYENQNEFPPGSDGRNFDMEAFIWLNGRLLLFSKNRTSPFSGYTYLHGIPDQPGAYKTQLLDSFYTGQGLMQQYWITGAAINPEKDKMVLLSYDKAWLFHPLDTNSLLGSPVRRLQFPSITQKEGVVFGSDSQIWMTDEYFSTFRNGGTLQSLDWKILLSNGKHLLPKEHAITPVPADDYIQIDGAGVRSLTILDLCGKTWMEINNPGNTRIPVHTLAKGIYLARIRTESGSQTLSWIKM